MDKLLSLLGGAPNIKPRNDDDLVDRMHRQITVCLLIIFSIVVSTKQYVGDPINCWVPAHFTGNHEEYTNTYCWVKNTYYLPFEDEIPKDHQLELRHMIPYYQWVPIILLLQSLMFFVPCLFWRSLNNKSGININAVVSAAIAYQRIDMKEAEEKSLDFMTNQVDRYLRNASMNETTNCTISLKHILSRLTLRCIGKRKGNYLITIYIITKLLYLTNLVGQLFMMERFLGSNFLSYGIDVLWKVWENTEWTGSMRFPRVTMCDFLIRRVGNIQRYTVQCALTINLFNERIYLFIWYWFVFLILITVTNILFWVVKSMFKRDKERYVIKHLNYKLAIDDNFSNFDDSTDKKFPGKFDRRSEKISEFVNNYLGSDGVFVLKLVGENTNTHTVTEMAYSLYNKYLENPYTKGF